MNKKIPQKLYEQILENVPLCCVDLVLNHNNKVLLVHRKEEPAKGQWWTFGGRILKNEKLEEAVIRVGKRELGLDLDIEKKIGSYEYFSKNGIYDLKTGTHAIVVGFLVKPLNGNQKIKLDETSSDYKWIDKIEGDLDPYVKRILKDSGVFRK